MRREFSAGGVVYRRDAEGKPQFLLIQDAWGRWTLPKGLVEKGEKPPQTAQREVREETGILVEPEASLDHTRYFYRDTGGELVYKTVFYFLLKAIDGELKPQEEEIAAARWFPASEAVGRCDYANTRPILEKALAEVTLRARFSDS